MKKFSKNKKLNATLNGIYFHIMESLGKKKVKRYYQEFRNITNTDPDYNIASYGNLLVYYEQIREFYKKCGYKNVDKWKDSKIWDIYRCQVGYVTRAILFWED